MTEREFLDSVGLKAMMTGLVCSLGGRRLSTDVTDSELDAVRGLIGLGWAMGYCKARDDAAAIVTNELELAQVKKLGGGTDA